MKPTIHDLGPRCKTIVSTLGTARNDNSTVRVHDGLGEASRPGSQEKDRLVIRLGLVDNKTRAQVLGRSLEVGQQVDVETGDRL